MLYGQPKPDCGWIKTRKAENGKTYPVTSEGVSCDCSKINKVNEQIFVNSDALFKTVTINGKEVCKLWDGHFYEYDENGLLNYIYQFKSGKYVPIQFGQ